jgi:NAD(P)-dependent dehydrogenase (short-subunit alcohol dehydrogenase family)
MEELSGRCAVVTGGGGLIGRGLSMAFGRAGMNVVVADIDADAAAATADEVSALGVRALSVSTDVTDPESVETLADRSYSYFGQVNVLCNNAGAVIRKPFIELTRSDWERVLSVQWGGVLNGVLAFLPRLLAQGGDRHIVNTSSMSGVGRADLRILNAPYVTAKFAVVGLSELMAAALAEHGIGVSVLCPGYTVADPSKVEFHMPSGRWYTDNLLTPEQVGAEVVESLREGRLHIFPHRAGRREVQDRFEMLMEAFDQAARTSPPESAPGASSRL